jgi:hypothetical protein
MQTVGEGVLWMHIDVRVMKKNNFPWESSEVCESKPLDFLDLRFTHKLEVELISDYSCRKIQAHMMCVALLQ